MARDRRDKVGPKHSLVAVPLSRVSSAFNCTTRATMSGFDADRVYTVSVYQNTPSFSTESPSETEKLLLDFLLQYRLGGEFIYRYASGSTDCVLR
jgi:hypothetical protein